MQEPCHANLDKPPRSNLHVNLIGEKIKMEPLRDSTVLFWIVYVFVGCDIFTEYFSLHSAHS